LIKSLSISEIALPEQFVSALPYILAVTGAGIFGSIIALFWSPNAWARSAIQHFTAGAVLAAIASNVVPEVEHMGTFAGVIGAFITGGLAMVGLKSIIVRLEHGKKYGNNLPVGLAAAAGVDTLLDGVITSAGFSIDPQLGTLLAIALALELLFLTLSVGVEFRQGHFKWWQSFAVTAGISSLFVLGALGAGILLADASEALLAMVLAFGAAALIYLIAEELLVETIEQEKSLFPTAMLFTGFAVLLALKLLS
jgi:zinc transporter, ZIP family